VPGSLVSGSIARYLPFGAWRTTPTQTLTDRGYTGHLENGYIKLLYMGSRWYDPYLACGPGAVLRGFGQRLGRVHEQRAEYNAAAFHHQRRQRIERRFGCPVKMRGFVQYPWQSSSITLSRYR
jgi:hypothetical protein